MQLNFALHMSELKSKTHFRLESLDAHYFNSSSKTQSNQNYEFLASKRPNLCFQYLRLQNKTTLKIKNKKKLRELSDITVTLIDKQYSIFSGRSYM